MFRDLGREGRGDKGKETKEVSLTSQALLTARAGKRALEWMGDGRRREKDQSWGKVEEEKTEGGFMIHLLAPDTRSILAEPRQSAHIFLHRSLSLSYLLSTLISRPHSSLPSIFVFSPVPVPVTSLASFLPNRQTSCYPSSYMGFWRLILMSILPHQNCR